MGMRITCPNCGGAHPAWDCRRPATKSTAARKDVRGSAPHQQPTERGEPGLRNLAGTQALPVDTNTADAEKSANLTRGVTAGETAPIQKRPRGRPRIHPDRKAYKAQWERDKRKRLKELPKQSAT